jgi:hypothetical protein
MNTAPVITANSSAVGATAPPPLLLRAIKEAVARGDKARVRAENFYITAGQHLKNLKENFSYGDWSGWEQMLRVKCNLSVGRASELMQIADGRKSLQQVRDGKAQSMARLRAHGSSPRGEEEIPDEFFEEGAARVATALPNGRAPLRGPQENNNKADASQLIDALAESTPAVRSAAVEALINGSHQTRFQSVTTAVIDLYRHLSRAGR